MSDYNNAIQQLCEKYPTLDAYIHKLQQKINHYEQGTASVYLPNKSTYQELELKVKTLESNRQKDIDELWETRITPLQNEVKDRQIQLETLNKLNERQKETIKECYKTIDSLNTVLNYAIGYISACEQFRDKHPLDVKKWLFGGLNQ